MRIRPGILIAIAAIFAVLIGGRFLGWFGSKPAEIAGGGPPAVTPGEANSPGPETPVTALPPRTTPVRPAPVVARPTPPPVVPQPPPAAASIADWEERIDTVLT